MRFSGLLEGRLAGLNGTVLSSCAPAAPEVAPYIYRSYSTRQATSLKPQHTGNTPCSTHGRLDTRANAPSLESRVFVVPHTWDQEIPILVPVFQSPCRPCCAEVSYLTLQHTGHLNFALHRVALAEEPRSLPQLELRLA